jgi:hypothetical protein
MKSAILAASSAVLLGQAASAQDGFYYGVGLGVTESSTNAPIVSSYTATATDVSLALTAGYRFAGSGAMTFGIEGNLDFLGGQTMTDGTDACTGTSPSWCTVDTVLRLRGTLTNQLANGGQLTSSLGFVMVKGVSENGFGNYLDTTGRGLSVGLGWQPSGGMPVRIDVNYDAIRDDNQPAYERDLDLIGLRVSYMF